MYRFLMPNPTSSSSSSSSSGAGAGAPPRPSESTFDLDAEIAAQVAEDGDVIDLARSDGDASPVAQSKPKAKTGLKRAYRLKLKKDAAAQRARDGAIDLTRDSDVDGEASSAPGVFGKRARRDGEASSTATGVFVIDDDDDAAGGAALTRAAAPQRAAGLPSDASALLGKDLLAGLRVSHPAPLLALLPAPPL
jgi:hypothetical protein